MSARYQHLALADVRPGMVLSDVLLDQHGQVLLAQGTTLTRAMIDLLPHHDVQTLAVLCASTGTPDAAAEAAGLDATAERIAHLFRKNDIDDSADWATGILHRYVADFRLGRKVEE